MKENIIKLLKQEGLSLTAVRLSVLEALEQHPHASAAKIFELVQQKIITTSIQAIYNNLNVLVERGVVREIKPKGQVSLYEARVNDNHHHMVCRSCEAVMDVDCQTVAPCLSPIDNHGFKVDEAEIIFWGICPSCQKSEAYKGE